MRLDKSLAKTISKRLGKSFASLKRLRVIEQFINGIRTTANGAPIDKGFAVLKGLKGKAVKVVQLVNATSIEYAGIRITRNANGSVSFEGTNTGGSKQIIRFCSFEQSLNGVSHKVLAYANLQGGIDEPQLWSEVSTYGIFMQIQGSGWEMCFGKQPLVGTTTNSGYYALSLVIADGQTINETVFPMVFDLTAMGLENCNTADEVAKALGYASIADVPYVPYTEGEILVSKPSRLISKGRNLWDEEWELGAFYEGELLQTDAYWRSKNNIYLSKGTYFVTAPYNLYYNWFNSSGDFKGSGYVKNAPLTMVEDGYIWIRPFDANINPHDICISEGSTPIPYEPYIIHTLLDGFIGYEGMDTIATIASEWGIDVSKVGKVDLGSLTWGIYEGFAYPTSFPSDIRQQGGGNDFTHTICPVYDVLHVADEDVPSSYPRPFFQALYTIFRLWNFGSLSGSEVKQLLSGVPLYYEKA